jgi:plasmid stabilization system protein ParE
MMLADFPRMGPSFDGEIRRLSIMRTNYILFYASRENDIEVLSIRHVRENWSVMGEDS